VQPEKEGVGKRRRKYVIPQEVDVPPRRKSGELGFSHIKKSSKKANVIQVPAGERRGKIHQKKGRENR